MLRPSERVARGVLFAPPRLRSIPTRPESGIGHGGFATVRGCGDAAGGGGWALNPALRTGVPEDFVSLQARPAGRKGLLLAPGFERIHCGAAPFLRQFLNPEGQVAQARQHRRAVPMGRAVGIFAQRHIAPVILTRRSRNQACG